MLNAIGEALTSVLGWFGSVVSSIVSPAVNGSGGELNALLPLLAIGIAIAITYSVIRLVRKIAWGA